MAKKITIDKSFKNWTRDDLQDYLGVKQLKKLQILEGWMKLGESMEITQEEIEFLEELRNEAKELIETWNETELRENFIIAMVNKIKFKDTEKNYFSFSERHISATIEKKYYTSKLHGFADWFVSEGIRKPKRPFFFIHEYKPEESKITDGRGQLIAAMYAAQYQNAQPTKPTVLEPTIHYYKNIPMYGCYVIGRIWFFAALKGDDYAISKGYMCTQKQSLQTIFKLLKAQKQMILEKIDNKQLVEV